MRKPMRKKTKKEFKKLIKMERKIIIETFSYIDENLCQHQKILFDGDAVWNSSDLAMYYPEDATLNRCMTSLPDIIDLIQMTEGRMIDLKSHRKCKTGKEFEKDLF